MIRLENQACILVLVTIRIFLNEQYTYIECNFPFFNKKYYSFFKIIYINNIKLFHKIYQNSRTGAFQGFGCINVVSLKTHPISNQGQFYNLRALQSLWESPVGYHSPEDKHTSDF